MSTYCPIRAEIMNKYTMLFIHDRDTDMTELREWYRYNNSLPVYLAGSDDDVLDLNTLLFTAGVNQTATQYVVRDDWVASCIVVPVEYVCSYIRDICDFHGGTSERVIKEIKQEIYDLYVKPHIK